MILMLDPFGYFFASAWYDTHLPFAATIFSSALCEKANAAIVIGWSISPALRTFPGTATTSCFFVHLLMRLMLTATCVLLELPRRSATSGHMLTSFSAPCLFRNFMSSLRSEFVVLSFFSLLHLDLALELF